MSLFQCQSRDSHIYIELPRTPSVISVGSESCVQTLEVYIVFRSYEIHTTPHPCEARTTCEIHTTPHPRETDNARSQRLLVRIPRRGEWVPAEPACSPRRNGSAEEEHRLGPA